MGYRGTNAWGIGVWGYRSTGYRGTDVWGIGVWGIGIQMHGV